MARRPHQHRRPGGQVQPDDLVVQHRIESGSHPGGARGTAGRTTGSGRQCTGRTCRSALGLSAGGHGTDAPRLWDEISPERIDGGRHLWEHVQAAIERLPVGVPCWCCATWTHDPPKTPAGCSASPSRVGVCCCTERVTGVVRSSTRWRAMQPCLRCGELCRGGYAGTHRGSAAGSEVRSAASRSSRECLWTCGTA